MKRILVADDEMILRMLIVDTFEGLQYDVQEAEDGSQALEKLMETQYDLVILDYMMPNMTGIEVLEQLPASKKAQLEILMLTAKTQERDKERMTAVGARYFMAKPFSPLELVALVEEILG